VLTTIRNFSRLEGLDIGLMVLDGDLVVHSWNAWLVRKSAVSIDQARSTPLRALFPEANLNILLEHVQLVLRTGEAICLNASETSSFIPLPLKNPCALFSVIQQRVSIAPLEGSDGSQVLVTIHDVTQERIDHALLEKKMEEVESLHRQLSIDSQTSLPTRAKLMQDMEPMKGIKIALISIDNYRDINNMFGFSACIKALRYFASILTSSFEGLPYDLRVYKLVGNEFALLADHHFADQRFIAFTRGVANHLNSASFRNDDFDIPFAISAGVCLGREQIMRRANLAMSEAQRDHTSCFKIYHDGLDNFEGIQQNIAAVRELKSALNAGRLIPYFQAICDSKTHQVVKFETLVRLKRSDGKIWSPFFFLDAAKRARLYPYLTREVIKRAMRYFRNTPYHFTLNLSIEDILNVETVTYLKRQLLSNNIANRVTLEILEDEGIEQLDEVTKFLSEMRDLGCEIAIDDFGSGYSNFDYLTKLDVDYIKIDGSIIKHIHDDKNARIVASSIVNFAQQLNIKVVAEFVCSAEIAAVALELGIDLLQGYHLSEPVPDVEAVIKRLGHCGREVSKKSQ